MRFTPAWQNPDEPAHYNYIAHIAEQGALPVLQSGDYDQACSTCCCTPNLRPRLPQRICATNPISRRSIYLTATPIFWLTDGSLLALRLYNVLLGAGSLLCSTIASRWSFHASLCWALGRWPLPHCCPCMWR